MEPVHGTPKGRLTRIGGQSDKPWDKQQTINNQQRR